MSNQENSHFYSVLPTDKWTSYLSGFILQKIGRSDEKLRLCKSGDLLYVSTFFSFSLWFASSRSKYFIYSLCCLQMVKRFLKCLVSKLNHPVSATLISFELFSIFTHLYSLRFGHWKCFQTRLLLKTTSEAGACPILGGFWFYD